MNKEEEKNETVIPQKKQSSGTGAIIAMSCVFLLVLAFTIFMGFKYFEAKNRTVEIGDTQYIHVK